MCIQQSTSNKSSQMKFEIDDLEFKSDVQGNLNLRKISTCKLTQSTGFQIQYNINKSGFLKVQIF